MSGRSYVGIIRAIEAAKNAYDIHALLVDGGFSSAVDAIQLLISDIQDNHDKACVVEFCTRHGGITMSNAQLVAWAWPRRAAARGAATLAPLPDANAFLHFSIVALLRMGHLIS